VTKEPTGRRRKRRKLPDLNKPTPDEDLHELASVLDEHRLDQNAAGWFKVPWRDGWCAVRLAVGCFDSTFDHYSSEREGDICKFLKLQIVKHECTAEGYWTAAEYLNGVDTDNVSPFLLAALRCLQVLISNSSGGGEVYNVILSLAFGRVAPDHLFEEIVLEHRCRDALGTTSIPQNDKNDRVRRAFSIAWRRGLYLAAYSLKPVEQ
jgi:hypothetical protein